MAPPDRSETFSRPNRSMSARIAGFIERTCVTTARWSIPMIVVAGGICLVYTVAGSLLIALGLWTPSFPFLSPTDDIYFAWLGFCSGAIVCLGTGSLIGLAFLTNGEGPVHNYVSILSSFIGFGFGAGVMRMTYLTVITSLL